MSLQDLSGWVLKIQTPTATLTTTLAFVVERVLFLFQDDRTYMKNIDDFTLFIQEMYQQYKDEQLEIGHLDTQHHLLTFEGYKAKNLNWLKQQFKQENYNG